MVIARKVTLCGVENPNSLTMGMIASRSVDMANVIRLSLGKLQSVNLFL